jgi:hypothetical protein
MTSVVTIVDTLPRRVNVTSSTRYWMGGTYVPDANNPNGGEFDSTGAVELFPVVDPPDPLTGETKITFTIPGITAGTAFDAAVLQDILDGNLVTGVTGVAPIHFSAFLGQPGGKDNTQVLNKDADEVANNEQLVNTVSIQATGDGRVVHELFGNLATNTISIVRLGVAALLKTVEEQVVETESTVAFNVAHQNIGENPYTDYRLLDVLSADGEVRGSDFHGGFTSREIEISFPAHGTGGSGTTSVSVYELTAAMLTNAAGTSATVLDVDTSALPAASTLTLPGSTTTVLPSSLDTASLTLRSDTVAVYVTGTLGKKDTYNMRVVLEPTGNAGRDIYFNDATASIASGGSAYILAPQVAATVVYRTLSGYAWLDKNHDGIQDAGEPAMAGVKVTLRDSTSNDIVKNRKDEWATAITGPDGKYEFTDLSQGSYYVRFENTDGSADPDFELRDYGVSPEKAGSNRAKDSDIATVTKANASTATPPYEYVTGTRTDN